MIEKIPAAIDEGYNKIGDTFVFLREDKPENVMMNGCPQLENPKFVTVANTSDKPIDIVRDIINTFYPKEALQTDIMADVPGILRDAVKLKFLREPLTDAQLKELIRTPPR